jgi:hypothetical protein
MRAAALIFGIIGGLWGLIGAILLIIAGGIELGLGDYSFTQEVGFALGGGAAGVIISVVGIVGGALAIKKPITAGVMMILSGILGFFATSIFYAVGGPILVAAGIFALVGSSESRRVRKVKAVPIGDEPNEIVVEPVDVTEIPRIVQ